MRSMKHKGLIAAVIARRRRRRGRRPDPRSARPRRSPKVGGQEGPGRGRLLRADEADDQEGQAGQLVWSNANYDTHNVTLIKGPKGVKQAASSPRSQASSGIHFKRTFLKPGTYHFMCTIHPVTMSMTVDRQEVAPRMPIVTTDRPPAVRRQRRRDAVLHARRTQLIGRLARRHRELGAPGAGAARRCRRPTTQAGRRPVVS